MEFDEKDIVFAVVKNDDGKLGYIDMGVSDEDALTLIAVAINNAIRVGREMIGLTDDELKENIDMAVKAGLESLDETVLS